MVCIINVIVYFGWKGDYIRVKLIYKKIRYMYNFLKIWNFVILLEVVFYFILFLKICDEWNFIFDRWKWNWYKEDWVIFEVINLLFKVFDENV